MIYDSKKPAPVSHSGFAVKHTEFYGKWLGCYQGPGIGVRYVRNACGKPIVFDHPTPAEQMAKDELIKAINRNKPIVARKEISFPKKTRRGGSLHSGLFNFR